MDDMTQNSGPSAAPTHATGLDRFFEWLRSIDLRRNGDDKWIAGTCSGIADRLGVDPIVVRAAVVLLTVMGGVGVTLYLVLWAFLPNDKEDVIAERALRDGDVGGIILLAFVALSLLGGTGLAGDYPGGGWVWWVVLPIVAVVWLVTRHRGERRPTQAPSGAPAAPGSSAPYGNEPYGATPYGSVPYGSGPGATAAPLAASASSAAPAAPTAPAAPYTSTATTAPYAPAGAPVGPGTQPGGSGGYPAVPGPPPRAPKPPRPPRPPRRRGGGFVATLLIGGLALAAYGLTMWAHDQADLAGSDQTVALCAALAVVGLGVLVLGLAGRRSGFTGFIAVVLALATWTASVVPDVTLGGGIGERTWRPSASDTSSEYRLSIGSAELDLAEAQDNPGTPRQVEARVGIGELRIWIPENLTVEVRSSVAAGDISGMEPRAGSLLERPRIGGPDPVDLDRRDGRDISTVQTFGEGSPDVVVDAHVGFGQILIGKE
jgi:phage shock protein PspC (stress-responsive transcriptional regulator)